MSTRKPIWVKMLLSPSVSHTPAMAHSRHIGTMRMTASGSDQLSYCAASTRKTSRTHSGKTNGGVAGQPLLVGQVGPLEADAVGQRLARQALHDGHRLARS